MGGSQFNSQPSIANRSFVLVNTATGISFIGNGGSDIRFYGSVSNEDMRLTNAGSLGINTGSPSRQLHLNGTGTGSGGFLVTNGTGQVVFLVNTANNKIGIGVSTPASLLDIEGSAAIGSTYSGTTAAPSNGLIVEGTVGIGTSAPQSKLDIEGSAAIGSTYSGTTAAPTNGLIVEGTVGIGTSSPSETLSIIGNVSLSKNLTISGMDGGVGQALCMKTNMQIGYCTSVVGVGGACTCA